MRGTVQGIRAQRGFTYLGLLFFVVITSAALAALGQSWSTAAQRERERELEFRGGEIARAIERYRKATAGPAQSPQSLDDLLQDRRGAQVLHHLRRAYVDPFTGKADWVLVAQPEQVQGFVAVHSRSERPLLRETQADGSATPTARDWIFAARLEDGGPALPPGGAGTPPVDDKGLPIR